MMSDQSSILCPHPSSTLKREGSAKGASQARKLRFSKEVAEEAEKELESIIQRPAKPVPRRDLPPSPRAERRLGFNFISSAGDTPEPLPIARRRTSSGSSTPPFSPAISRAHNPITANSPFRDADASPQFKEGAELGLLSISPENRLLRRGL